MESNLATDTGKLEGVIQNPVEHGEGEIEFNQHYFKFSIDSHDRINYHCTKEVSGIEEVTEILLLTECFGGPRSNNFGNHGTLHPSIKQGSTVLLSFEKHPVYIKETDSEIKIIFVPNGESSVIDKILNLSLLQKVQQGVSEECIFYKKQTQDQINQILEIASLDFPFEGGSVFIFKKRT